MSRETLNYSRGSRCCRPAVLARREVQPVSGIRASRATPPAPQGDSNPEGRHAPGPLALSAGPDVHEHTAARPFAPSALGSTVATARIDQSLPSLLRLLLTLALLGASLAAANTRLPIAELSSPDAEVRQLGQGRMRWFGLLLYDATLWVSGPVTGTEWRWDRSFALDIRYARDFQGRKLADASVDEIRRLGIADDARLEKWRAFMVAAFPDVTKGQHITGVFRPGIGVEFYHQDRSTGIVRDPEFARAFFSIWLDPRTREPKLRAALLGQK